MPPQVLSTVGEHAGAMRQIGGALLWTVAANSYQDYDGTTIYLAPAAPPERADAAVLETLYQHAAYMASLPSAWSCASRDFRGEPPLARGWASVQGQSLWRLNWRGNETNLNQETRAVESGKSGRLH